MMPPERLHTDRSGHQRQFLLHASLIIEVRVQSLQRSAIGSPASHELQPLIHDRTLLPGHPLPPKKGESVTHVSGTFCQLCVGSLTASLHPFFRSGPNSSLRPTSGPGASASEAPSQTKTQRERCCLHVLGRLILSLDYLGGAASRGRTSRSTLSAISSSATSSS